MPWHVANNPAINYSKRIVNVGLDTLPLLSLTANDTENASVVNMDVRKFRRLLKKRPTEDLQLYQVSNMKSMTTEDDRMSSRKELLSNPNQRLKDILSRYEMVFQDELSNGLPPKRSVDHDIEVEKDAKPPNRPLYQLSRLELEAAKMYIEV